MHSLAPWLIFFVLVLASLALDLGVFHRRAHAMDFREAAAWSAFWMAVSLAFAAGISWRWGAEPALQFLTGYVLENSLSADNVFLFAVIFTSMSVAAEYQHRVLFWGVLGALLTRGVFILAGVQLVRHFHAVLYGFALLLLIMGVRLLLDRGRKYDPANSRLTNFARRIFPIAEQYEAGRFFTRCQGRLCATPLLLVLVIIELVDIAFSVDSIPAVFSVTQDAFLIFTSNILAVLGLRSLYFLLAEAISRFRYLHAALGVILIFMSARMLSVHWIIIPTALALLVILSLLVIAMLASMWCRSRSGEKRREYL
jgi:tellurite resistance protein TerC